ncbi:MAG TPA: methylmalonyl-CoA epimerase [Thermomicrobiales bacterium]|nr:methylmalonyl-CoA epimerase [Thermomicrobiales bacterium]
MAQDTMLLALGGLRLHHIGVVVEDLDVAAERYAALGFIGGERFSVPEQAIEAIVYAAGEESYVELISPTDPEGPIARFMGKRGEGMHHVAYLVDDIEAMIARLHDAGIRLIDETPRKGTHGWTIAFVHPESTHGVLTELVQTD